MIALSEVEARLISRPAQYPCLPGNVNGNLLWDRKGHPFMTLAEVRVKPSLPIHVSWQWLCHLWRDSPIHAIQSIHRKLGGPLKRQRANSTW